MHVALVVVVAGRATDPARARLLARIVAVAYRHRILLLLLPFLMVPVAPVGARAADLQAAHKVRLQVFCLLAVGHHRFDRRRPKQAASPGDDPLARDALPLPAVIALPVRRGQHAAKLLGVRDLQPHVIELLLDVGTAKNLRFFHTFGPILEIVVKVGVEWVPHGIHEHPFPWLTVFVW